MLLTIRKTGRSFVVAKPQHRMANEATIVTAVPGDVHQHIFTVIFTVEGQASPSLKMQLLQEYLLT